MCQKMMQREARRSSLTQNKGWKKQNKQKRTKRPQRMIEVSTFVIFWEQLKSHFEDQLLFKETRFSQLLPIPNLWHIPYFAWSQCSGLIIFLKMSILEPRPSHVFFCPYGWTESFWEHGSCEMKWRGESHQMQEVSAPLCAMNESLPPWGAGDRTVIGPDTGNPDQSNLECFGPQRRVERAHTTRIKSHRM